MKALIPLPRDIITILQDTYKTLPIYQNASISLPAGTVITVCSINIKRNDTSSYLWIKFNKDTPENIFDSFIPEMRKMSIADTEQELEYVRLHHKKDKARIKEFTDKIEDTKSGKLDGELRQDLMKQQFGITVRDFCTWDISISRRGENREYTQIR